MPTIHYTSTTKKKDAYSNPVLWGRGVMYRLKGLSSWFIVSNAQPNIACGSSVLHQWRHYTESSSRCEGVVAMGNLAVSSVSVGWKPNSHWHHLNCCTAGLLKHWTWSWGVLTIHCPSATWHQARVSIFVLSGMGVGDGWRAVILGKFIVLGIGFFKLNIIGLLCLATHWVDAQGKWRHSCGIMPYPHPYSQQSSNMIKDKQKHWHSTGLIVLKIIMELSICNI